MGSASAIALLAQEPTYPVEIEYLVEWAQLLYGRSGAHMSGAVPLSPVVLESWARLMDLGTLHPWEVEALFLLDAAMVPPKEESQPSEK